MRFVYKGEGQKSPTAANSNYYSVNLATKRFAHSSWKNVKKKEKEPKEYLKINTQWFRIERIYNG